MISNKQKYCIFDAETEGLNLIQSRPWELSYVLATGSKITKRHQIYIDWPNLHLSDLIKKLTGFNQAKYDANKISPEEAWDFFEPILYNPDILLVGQNILKFDVWMLNILYRHVHDKPLDFSFMDRFMDNRFIAMAHKNGLTKPRDNNYLDWFYKIHNDRSLKGKVSQGVLLKDFSIDHDPKKLHDGLYDCEMSFLIFLYLKKAMKL